MKIKEFLETIPLYEEVEIEDINIKHIDFPGSQHFDWNTPGIFIHCEKCNGERFFSISNSPPSFRGGLHLVEYRYHCNNCSNYEKYFVLLGQGLPSDNLSKGKLTKIGEFPPFGKPTPSKLITLIGPDKDTFLNGRRCENQGLGIGAYAYYRRVIESQKNRIIDQIIKICEQYENNDDLIQQLELAKSKRQFSTAIDMIKQNLPSSLLIEGNNPLKLLHKALSKGLHEMTDDECMKRANSIRIILTELCFRMSELLKDDKEIKNAINLLLNPSKEPPHA
jgi:hypothetical protein